MVSEFLCVVQGRLHHIDESQGVPVKVYATEIIKYESGKSDDSWWDAEKMVEQTKKVITIFNKAFPGDITVFAFDNSSEHACKTKDILVVNKINFCSGSK